MLGNGQRQSGKSGIAKGDGLRMKTWKIVAPVLMGLKMSSGGTDRLQTKLVIGSGIHGSHGSPNRKKVGMVGTGLSPTNSGK